MARHERRGNVVHWRSYPGTWCRRTSFATTEFYIRLAEQATREAVEVVSERPAFTTFDRARTPGKVPTKSPAKLAEPPR